MVYNYIHIRNYLIQKYLELNLVQQLFICKTKELFSNTLIINQFTLFFFISIAILYYKLLFANTLTPSMLNKRTTSFSGRNN